MLFISRIERALRDLLQRPPVRRARRRRRGARGRRRERAVSTSTARPGRRTAGRSISCANIGVHEELFVVPAAGGKPRQLTDGKHNIGSLVGQSRPQSAVRADHQPLDQRRRHLHDARSATRAPTQVTHVFDNLARDFTLRRQEAIKWKGADGVTVEGVVTYPADYQAGQKYPLAVMTHGGPQAADKFSFGSMSVRNPGARRRRATRPAAELPRQHRLRRRVPARHGRPLLPERAPRRDGRRRRGDPPRASPIPIAW